MDIVTFELAPTEVRVRAIGVLAAALVLELIAMSLLTSSDLAPSGAGQFFAAAFLLIFGLGLFARLFYVGLTTYLGRPLVKRGLFRSKMRVAWKSHVRAQIFTGFVTALAIVTALDAHTRWGGLVFLLATGVGHAGLYLINSDRRLAAVQLWAEPMAAPASVAKPVRAQRPMIDSPLPPPPSVGDAPFRVPAQGLRLEDRLVKPALPTATPEVVASGNADEPSFLR